MQGVQNQDAVASRQIAAQHLQQCCATIPGWKDPSRREQDAREMASWMSANGYSEANIQSLYHNPHPATVASIYKSWKHDGGDTEDRRSNNKVRVRHQSISLSQRAVSRLLHKFGPSPQRPICRSYKQSAEELEVNLDTTFPQLKRQA